MSGLDGEFISAFDLDHTLCKENTSYCFGRYLCDKKYLSALDLLYIMQSAFCHRMGLMSIERLHHQAFQRLFLGRSASEIKLWATNFLDDFFLKSLYPPALDALKVAQSKGHVIALLSSSPEFLVEPIAERLNIPIWHSTRYALDASGRFSAISTLMLGDTKASLLDNLREKLNIPIQHTYAYSDSHLDLQFLRAAGNPVGVKPNRQLRALCTKNRWPMI